MMYQLGDYTTIVEPADSDVKSTRVGSVGGALIIYLI